MELSLGRRFINFPVKKTRSYRCTGTQDNLSPARNTWLSTGGNKVELMRSTYGNTNSEEDCKKNSLDMQKNHGCDRVWYQTKEEYRRRKAKAAPGEKGYRKDVNTQFYRRGYRYRGESVYGITAIGLHL